MATQAPAAAPVVHPLTLKVMRLFLPGLEVRMPDPVAELRPYPGGGGGGGGGGGDAAAATAAASAAAGGGSGPGPGPAGDDGLSVDEARYGLTGLIRLPVEFGTIYLGQYFSAYIVVANYSGYDVDNVHLMAELQTGSQRVQLTDKRLSSKAGQYLTPAPTNPAPSSSAREHACTRAWGVGADSMAAYIATERALRASAVVRSFFCPNAWCVVRADPRHLRSQLSLAALVVRWRGCRLWRPFS